MRGRRRGGRWWKNKNEFFEESINSGVGRGCDKNASSLEMTVYRVGKDIVVYNEME